MRRAVGFPRAPRNALENAVFGHESETRRSIARAWAQSLDKFLVSVGLMEGDEFDLLFVDQFFVAVPNVVVRKNHHRHRRIC